MISPQDITGLVLAGGQGSRMGGLDKGLQTFHGQPLALHAVERLRPQVGRVAINARRDADSLEAYARPGVAVLTDATPADPNEPYPGPLAAFLTGLMHCDTPWLLTIPCDAPLFPLDLAQRLAAAAQGDGALLAVAVSAAPSQVQPVFCLMHKSLAPSLAQYLADGGRKVRAWQQQHGCRHVVFDQPHDAPHAFSNANTLAELRALETRFTP